MKDIKFRIWDDILKYYSKDNNTIGLDGLLYKTTKPRIITLLKKWNVNIEVVEGCIIERFTGLQDKNGIDIYEGDKVRFIHESNYRNDEAFCEGDWNYGTIVWGGSYPAFDIDNHSEDCNLLSSPEYNIEVIGNIHEEN